MLGFGFAFGFAFGFGFGFGLGFGFGFGLGFGFGFGFGFDVGALLEGDLLRVRTHGVSDALDRLLPPDRREKHGRHVPRPAPRDALPLGIHCPPLGI